MTTWGGGGSIASPPWILSSSAGNDRDIALDNNPGTQLSTAPVNSGSISGQFGKDPIPLNAKTQFEIVIGGTVSPWYYLQTAFGLGVGIHGLGYGTNNKQAFGEIVLNASYVLIQYNRCVVNSRDTIADPDGDNIPGIVHPTPIGAAASVWRPGDIIDILVDRLNTPNTISFYRNGLLDNGNGTRGATGTYDIRGLAGKAIYPCTQGWWLRGPTAKIRGGGANQAFAYTFAGYSPLDGGAATPTGPGTITISVTPNPVVSTAPFSVVATGTTGGAAHAFSSLANVEVSTQITGSPDGFVPAASQTAGASQVLTASNVVTFTGLSVPSAVPHDIKVTDIGNGVISNTVPLTVTATATPSAVPVDNAAFRFAPFIYAGNSGRVGSLTRTSSAKGAWVDFYVNSDASPSLQFNVSSSPAGATFDYLIGGALKATAVGGSVVNITGLVPNALNWVRLYYGEEVTGFTHVTISGAVVDIGSIPATAPAPRQAILFEGDSISQGAGCRATQSYVYLIAQSLGLTTWDVANSSYGGNSWTITGEGSEYYYNPAALSSSRWNKVGPGGISVLDTAGDISAYGALNTYPKAKIFNLGTNEVLHSGVALTMQAAIVAAMAAERAACSPATALIILIPFGIYDTVVYPTGPTFVAAIKAAITQANAAGSNVQMVDLGAAFGIAMRTTAGRLQGDNIHPTPTGHAVLAPAYLAGILPLLTAQPPNPATVNVTVPVPLQAGVQVIRGTFTNGTNPANLWTAWSPSPAILTVNAVLATITGSTFSATMNLTPPTGSGASLVTRTMYYSTNANQAVTTITDPSLADIVLPTIPDQLTGTAVSLQVGFNYVPNKANIAISIGNDPTAAAFEPLSASGSALPVGAAITVPSSIPTQQSGKVFNVQVGFNYIPNRANLFFSPANGAAPPHIIDSTSVTAFADGPPNGGTIVWDATGQLATFSFSLNSLITWTFQIFDTTAPSAKSGALTFANATSSPTGGGTYTVPTPGAPLNVVGNSNPVWDASGQIVTITIPNPAADAWYLQIADTTYSATDPIVSPSVLYNVTAVAVTGGGLLTVPTPGAPISLQAQTNGTWTLAPGNWDIPVVATTRTLTVNFSNNTALTRVVAAGVSIVSQTLQLYTLFLFTPAQSKPNVPIVLYGEFVAGTPTALDYTLNGGATWIALPTSSVTFSIIPPFTQPDTNYPFTPVVPPVTTATGAFAISLPLGVPAGIYDAGKLMVRDHAVSAVFAAAGRWVVDPFDVTVLTTGTLVMGFDPAVPACIGLDTVGYNVLRINDIAGSGRHMSLGPTERPTPEGWPPPLVVNTGTDVLDATPVGPLAPLVRLSGADGTRTLVGMTPTSIGSGSWDRNANFFSAGPRGGPNNALIDLFSSSNMTVGTQTVVEAMQINVHVTGGLNAGYGIGLIWGYWPTDTTVSYLTPGRWHSSNFSAQFHDDVSAMALSTGTGVTADTWAVVTLQRNGSLFQWRMNKGPWFTATITATNSFNATGCFWGGSVAPNVNQPGGNAEPFMGAFYAFQGALSLAELGQVESLVGHSIGLAI